MVAADTLIAPAALFCDIVIVKADTKSAHLRPIAPALNAIPKYSL